MENQKDGGILTVLELGTEIGLYQKYGKAVEAQKMELCMSYTWPLGEHIGKQVVMPLDHLKIRNINL